MPKRSKRVANDTEEAECEAESIEECSHFDSDGEKVMVGGYLNKELVFKLQSIADEFYGGNHSKEAHKGNRTPVLKDIIEASYKLVKQNDDIEKSENGNSVLKTRLLSGNYESEDAVSKAKFEKVKKELEDERRKRERLEKRVERLKTRREITDDEELQNAIQEIVEDDAKTFDEIVDKMKELGLDIQRYDHPKVHGEYKVRMGDVVDFLVNHMVDTGKLEVKQTNDGTVYRA